MGPRSVQDLALTNMDASYVPSCTILSSVVHFLSSVWSSTLSFSS